MPRRTNDFQGLIFAIQKQLAGAAKVTESKKVDDEVEIDICIESNVASEPVTIAIECNGEARRATVEWIREMKGKYERRYADKVVLVSKAGFTERARLEARAARIETLTLEQAYGVEWPKEVERLSEMTVEGYSFRMLEVRTEWIAEDELLRSLKMDNATVVKCEANDNWHLAEDFINAFLKTDFATKSVLERIEREKGLVNVSGATFDLVWETAGRVLFKDTDGVIARAHKVFIKAELNIVRRRLRMEAVKYREQLFVHSEMDDIFAKPEAVGEKISVTIGVENGVPTGLTMLRRIRGRNEPIDVNLRRPQPEAPDCDARDT